MAEPKLAATGRRRWWLSLRKSLFASPLDGLITLLLLAAFAAALQGVVHWALVQANWSVIVDNLPLWFTGSFTKDQVWRSWTWMASLLLLCVVTLSPRWLIPPALARWLPLLWLLALPVGLLLLAGGLGLEPVASNRWGGLQLSLLLALASTLLSLPIGILLALGRRSKLPLLKWMSTGYIELIRGIPMITVLFFGQLLIPLFLPMDWTVNRVLRAILSLGFFTGAYVAECVRGGLQSIPKTQLEAARALGLSTVQTIVLVELPQALRTALPALTNQFVGLIQDTALLSIVGLVELLGISRSILANPDYVGRYVEVYIWLALLYWAICTLMMGVAGRIEHSLKGAEGNRS